MDTDTLVDQQIEEGQKLVAQLRQSNFDVVAAFWAKTSEEGRWFMYIASKAFDERGAASAYREAYGILRTMELTSISMSEIKLVSPANPIARDAMVERDRHQGRFPTRYQGATLGNLAIEEAVIYPPASAAMTRRELLQTLFAMANRPPGTLVQPSLIALRDGSTRQAIITGFNLQMPGGLTIHIVDPDNSEQSQILGEDVASIQ